MGFLTPLFLLAAAAAAVPIVLHLYHRHESRRLSFPALRYLLRTEREHARRIRLRQLLLLLLRTAVVLLLALAGARPFLEGPRGDHRPTALAIVLDNSLSSGRVVGDERVLDFLRRRALATLAAATEGDRVWVLRAAEPWDVAVPGTAEEARGRIVDTEVSAAAADLTATTRRAVALVRQAGLPAAEVHVLSDLQATGLPPGETSSDVPVLVFHSPEAPPPNRYLGAVQVGGGLPPLAGRRTEIAAGVGGDTAEAPLRLVVADRIRAATRVPPGATASLPFGPFQSGRITGYVETDPDALGGDDRRWFSIAIRPPPSVAVRGDTPFFLDQALSVLEEAGRLRRGSAAPEILLAMNGEGAGAVREGVTVVVVPPTDPALLPAVNLRLAEAGIPWRYEPVDARGDARIGEHRVPLPLEELRVSGGYRLVGGATAGAEVLARLQDGSPWLVRGGRGSGGYRLVGSAFDPDATNLPVSAFMVPLLEWLVAPPGAEQGRGAVEAGTSLPLPPTATAVETPDGVRHPVGGTREFRPTRQSGVYRILAGDSTLSAVAVNAPIRESLLATADEDAVSRALGPARLVTDTARWEGDIFLARQGVEFGRALLWLTLLLLLVEGWAAASGGQPGGAKPARRPRARVAPDVRTTTS